MLANSVTSNSVTLQIGLWQRRISSYVQVYDENCTAWCEYQLLHTVSIHNSFQDSMNNETINFWEVQNLVKLMEIDVACSGIASTLHLSLSMEQNIRPPPTNTQLRNPNWNASLSRRGVAVMITVSSMRLSLTLDDDYHLKCMACFHNKQLETFWLVVNNGIRQLGLELNPDLLHCDPALTASYQTNRSDRAKVLLTLIHWAG